MEEKVDWDYESVKITDIKKKVILEVEMEGGPIVGVNKYRHLEFKEWEYQDPETEEWIYMINSYHTAELEQALLDQVDEFRDEYGNRL